MTREEVKRAIEHDVYRAKCRGLSQKQIEYFSEPPTTKVTGFPIVFRTRDCLTVDTG